MDEFLKDIHFSVFFEWVKHYPYENMDVSYNENTVFISTKYSKSEIRFNEMNIIELDVQNTYTDEEDFYLHFQMKNLKHACNLFYEMLEAIKNLIHKPKTKILLSCSGGLTTSFFAESLNDAAKAVNMDYSFNAVGFTELDNYASDYDIILLAPQIAYEHAHVQEKYGHKIVLNIPSRVFASYNCGKMLRIIRETQETREKIEKEPIRLSEVTKAHGEILTLILIRNSNRVHLGCRLFGKDNEILEDYEIIKYHMSLEDIFDEIDTVLVTHKHVDAIGIATPGIINDGVIETTGLPGIEDNKQMNFKEAYNKRYRQKLVLCNDVNSIAVGYHACQNQYHNISVIFQPVSAHAGMGHIINDELHLGHQSMAGEVQFLPLALSKSKLELNKTEKGSLELISQMCVDTIATISPDLIVICNVFTHDVDKLKAEIEKTIPAYYIPDIALIHYLQEYSFIGNLILCIRELYA